MLPEQPACRHGKVRDVPRRTDWGACGGRFNQGGDGPPLIAGGTGTLIGVVWCWRQCWR